MNIEFQRLRSSLLQYCVFIVFAGFLTLNLILLQASSNYAWFKPSTSIPFINSVENSIFKSTDAIQLQGTPNKNDSYEKSDVIRSVLISSWRSGSTLIGELISSVPNTFYHYEPLCGYGLQQIRSGPSVTESINILHHLLHCNYSSDMDAWLDTQKYIGWGLDKNGQYIKKCLEHYAYKNNLLEKHTLRRYCNTKESMELFCSSSRIQAMKINRIRLNNTRSLLEDKKLNVRLLYLVRDPRSTIHSRQNPRFCRGRKNCDDLLFCDDLVQDFISAKKFARDFPHSFMVIRLEDFVLNNSLLETKELFRFLGLNVTNRTLNYLKNHFQTETDPEYRINSVSNIANTFETRRNSLYEVTQWRHERSWNAINEMQIRCRKALHLWGYETANEDNYETFNPIQNFTFSEII